jgi:hypothetical protein
MGASGRIRGAPVRAPISAHLLAQPRDAAEQGTLRKSVSTVEIPLTVLKDRRGAAGAGGSLSPMLIFPRSLRKRNQSESGYLHSTIGEP